MPDKGGARKPYKSLDLARRKGHGSKGPGFPFDIGLLPKNGGNAKKGKKSK